jgi:hypothetical protein
MGLIMDRDQGGTQIPPGEKIRVKIREADLDWGEHGPQARLNLEVLTEKYRGERFTEWATLAQPRLDFVKNLRGKNYEDEKIAEILRQRGFEFKDIDEPEEAIRISDGGKMFNIAIACFDGNVDAINALDSIDDLLEALKGRTFVSLTRRCGQDDKYLGLVWDQVYTDPDADFGDIPF